MSQFMSVTIIWELVCGQNEAKSQGQGIVEYILKEKERANDIDWSGNQTNAVMVQTAFV